jgi:hypothetical protein
MASPISISRHRIRRLAAQFNQHIGPDDSTPESLSIERRAMLEPMLGKAGKRIYIEPPLFLDYGCNTTIGEDCYSNFKYMIPFALAEYFGMFT